MNLLSLLEEKGKKVISAPLESTIGDVAAILNKHKIGAILVMSEDVIKGILSERDIVHMLAQKGEGCTSVPVSDVMTTKVITASPKDTLPDVMRIMTERRIRHLPVVSQGELLGIVSIGDVVKKRLEQIGAENQTLTDWIAG